MKLLTQALRKKLPPLGATCEDPDPIVMGKFFYPDFYWTFYAIEFDGKDIFYGYVDGDFPELGTFSLSELQNTRGKLGCPIERDKFFRSCRLSEVQKEVEIRHGMR